MIIGPSRKHICICTWRVIQRGHHGLSMDGTIENSMTRHAIYRPLSLATHLAVTYYSTTYYCYSSDKVAILSSINDRTRQCFNEIVYVVASARLGGSWSSWQEPMHLSDKTRANFASQEPNGSWRREGVSAQASARRVLLHSRSSFARYLLRRRRPAIGQRDSFGIETKKENKKKLIEH